MSTTKSKVFEKFSKNFRKNFTSFTHSPHQIFFPKILQVPPLSQHQTQKNYKSLPTTRNKVSEKFYKFSKRIPKKGHACIVTGGQVPPRYKPGIFTTTTLYDEYIDRPKLTEQKNPFEYIVLPPPPPPIKRGRNKKLFQVPVFSTVVMGFVIKVAGRIPVNLKRVSFLLFANFLLEFNFCQFCGCTVEQGLCSSR